MKKTILLIILAFVVIGCSSSRTVTQTKKRTATPYKKNKVTAKGTATLADKIVWTAVTFKGTPYKYGGTTKAGMDCSGLIQTSFKSRGVDFPRVSYEMSTKGYNIAITQVKRGDLLFFKTSKSAKGVNHVGLVTSANKGEIQFIHATSSRGVIVSSFSERYWNRAFVKAKRVL